MKIFATGGQTIAEMLIYHPGQEKHLRGRTAENIVGLLIEGHWIGYLRMKYEIIPNEIDALKHSMSLAKPVHL